MKTKKKITRRSFLKKAGVLGGAAVLGGIGFPNIS
ncbi:MAG: twin-arginine translocation signal domain-containing protein, partial [Thermodesulfobacteriota bacterium]